MENRLRPPHARYCGTRAHSHAGQPQVSSPIPAGHSLAGSREHWASSMGPAAGRNYTGPRGSDERARESGSYVQVHTGRWAAAPDGNGSSVGSGSEWHGQQHWPGARPMAPPIRALTNTSSLQDSVVGSKCSKERNRGRGQRQEQLQAVAQDKKTSPTVVRLPRAHSVAPTDSTGTRSIPSSRPPEYLNNICLPEQSGSFFRMIWDMEATWFTLNN